MFSSRTLQFNYFILRTLLYRGTNLEWQPPFYAAQFAWLWLCSTLSVLRTGCANWNAGPRGSDPKWSEAYSWAGLRDCILNRCFFNKLLPNLEQLIVQKGGSLALCPKLFYIPTGNSFMKLFCNHILPRSEQGIFVE